MKDSLSELRDYLISVFKQYRNKDIVQMINALSKELVSSFQIEAYLNGIDENWRMQMSILCQALTKSYSLFNMGLIGDCYDLVYDVIFKQFSPSDLGIATTLKKNTELFRMRSSNHSYLYDKMGMSHIPFNLRNKISNQRFSLSGFPCLYLGSSLYVCWEELNRPNFENANSALFITQKELKLLDLRFPANLTSKESLLQFLLAASASLKSSEPNDTFKAEYIIPQAILHSLVKHNYVSNEDNQYDGIIYTSSFYWTSDKLWDDENLFFNIVIPASISSLTETGSNNVNNYSTKIITSFEIKGPCTYNLYDYKQESYTGCAPSSCNVLYRDSQLDYDRNIGYDGYFASKFHRLSEYLIANCK